MTRDEHIREQLVEITAEAIARDQWNARMYTDWDSGPPDDIRADIIRRTMPTAEAVIKALGITRSGTCEEPVYGDESDFRGYRLYAAYRIRSLEG